MIVVAGSLNIDTVLEVEALPRPGETVTAKATNHVHGGKGGNQAVAASRLGADVEFIGAVGTDSLGDALIASLADEGISVDHVSRTTGSSGSAFVMVDRLGENAIVVSPGANHQVVLDDASLGLIAEASVVLLQLEIPGSVVLEAARAATGTIVLNAAPATTLPEGLVEAVDVLVVNREELSSLAGGHSPAAARSLGVKTVIVTLGAEGAQVITPGDLATFKPPKVNVADTTGAGDAFCGALVAGLDRGLDIYGAAAEAVVAGALATTGLGARTAMPTLPRLTRAMRDYL